MSYTKLFNSIINSTIWTENDKTRIMWITMLALADKNGEIQASIPGLARAASVSIPDCESAITKFLAPDPYSRSPEDEGRRIEKIEGGWALLNHSKYRALASKDDSKSANLKRQQRFRERKERNSLNALVTPCNAPVTPCNAHVTLRRDIAEAEAKAKEEEDTLSEIGRKADYPQLVESLWRIFPATSRNRSSKKKVADSIKKIRIRPSDDIIIESARQWASSHGWTKDSGQFAPGIHIWVKDRKWESEPETSLFTPAKTTSAANYGI